MALLTAAEARKYLPGLASSGDDTFIDVLIGLADAAMAKYCGYPAYDATGAIHTLEDQTYTLYLPGRDGLEVTSDGSTIRVPVRPLVSVTTIHDDTDWDYGASFLVASADYTDDLQRAEILLLPTSTHGAFSQSFRALKVVVVAGFATPPEHLKLACRLLVAHWYDLRTTHGKMNIQGASVSDSLRPETWPESVLELLHPFILPGAILG